MLLQSTALTISGNSKIFSPFENKRRYFFQCMLSIRTSKLEVKSTCFIHMYITS